MAALRRQLPELLTRPKDRISYPASWLNGGEWRDEVEQAESVDDPYRNLPHTYDCQVCKSFHEVGQSCEEGR